MSQPADASHLFTKLLLGPAEALYKTTEGGSGVLTVDRPWVRHEGWLLKEAGMAGSWHPRYFAVRGDVLEYFKEETAKLSVKGDERLGLSLDHSNVVMGVERGSISAPGPP